MHTAPTPQPPATHHAPASTPADIVGAYYRALCAQVDIMQGADYSRKNPALLAALVSAAVALGGGR